MLQLACSAKAPNPEAQHATTLRGKNVLEPCVRTANHIEEKDTCTVKKLLWSSAAVNVQRTCAWIATAWHSQAIKRRRKWIANFSENDDSSSKMMIPHRKCNSKQLDSSRLETQRRIPHGLRRRSFCGAVLLSMCSARAHG